MTTATSPKAPRTVGPNLAAMTMRERAQAAWEQEIEARLARGQRRAKELALTVLGVNHLEFESDWIPLPWIDRTRSTTDQQIAFEVEGMRFLYLHPTTREPERLALVAVCPTCTNELTLLTPIGQLADIAAAYLYGEPDPNCNACKAILAAQAEAVMAGPAQPDTKEEA